MELYFYESWPFLGSEQQFPGHRVPLNVELPYTGVPIIVNLGQLQDEIQNALSTFRRELWKEPNYMSQGLHARGNGRW